MEKMTLDCLKAGEMQILLIVFCVLIPTEAFAYLGPGLSVGTAGTLIGILLAVCFSLWALIWYPLKLLFMKIFRIKAPEVEKTSNPESKKNREADGIKKDASPEN